MINPKYEVEIYFEETGTICSDIEQELLFYPMLFRATLHRSLVHAPYITLLCESAAQARETEQNLIKKIKNLGGSIIRDEDE